MIYFSFILNIFSFVIHFLWYLFDTFSMRKAKKSKTILQKRNLKKINKNTCMNQRSPNFFRLRLAESKRRFDVEGENRLKRQECRRDVRKRDDESSLIIIIIICTVRGKKKKNLKMYHEMLRNNSTKDKKKKTHSFVRV